MKDFKSNLQALVRLRMPFSLFAPSIHHEYPEELVELTTDSQTPISTMPVNPLKDGDQDCACE